MSQYRSGNRFNLLPPVVKNLLIINALMLLASYVLKGAANIDLWELFGLHPFGASNFYPFQIVTHIFMHGNFTHLFFNMFALWMFGSGIENIWGPKRFLIYYFVTAFGAALLFYLVSTWQMQPILGPMNTFIHHASPDNLQAVIDMVGNKFGAGMQSALMGDLNGRNLTQQQDLVATLKDQFLSQHVMVGASGAVYGILLAFGMMFPNSLIYIYFLFPVKAKYLVIFFGLLELYSGIANNPGDNVAHFAHVGGMLFGFILIKIWNKGNYRVY